MGFFDILRKIFKRNTDQLLLDVGTPVYGKFEHGEIFGETIPIFDNSGDTIQFKTPRNTGKKFQNLDGEKSVVYTANIVKYDEDGYTSDLKGKMISFELPETLDIKDAMYKGLIAVLLNRPKAYMESLNRNIVNHLGRINSYGSILDSHSEVEAWVTANLTTELQARIAAANKEMEKAHLRNLKEQKAKTEEKVIEVEEKRAEIEKEKEIRVKNPEFVRQMDGSFKITNINNGNDIDLTIQNIELITHANGVQEYYYSAFKQETKHGKACKVNPSGINFEFSLPAEYDLERLYQMAKDQSNPEYANSIAVMVSEVLSKEPAYNMNLWNYAGGIDLKDGGFEYKEMGVDAHKTVGRVLQERQEKQKRAAMQQVNGANALEIEER